MLLTPGPLAPWLLGSLAPFSTPLSLAQFSRGILGEPKCELGIMKGLVVLILAFASFSFRAPTAYGSFLSFQNLVVFGDSLSDNGNTFISVGLPKAPYYDGRWTNGPNWVDYFSQLAGIPDVSAFLRNGGTNFAVGGSTSLYLAGEIATYLADNAGRADPANLYVV
jgi:phospholipase/lecithinase/hemolysin